MSRNDPLQPTPPPGGATGSWQDPNGQPTIGPTNLLQRAQQFGQSYEPVKRLISAVDWMNQNVLGGPQDQLGNFGTGPTSGAQALLMRPQGSASLPERVMDLLKNTQLDPLMDDANALGRARSQFGNISTAFDRIKNNFGSHELPEVQKYLQAIDAWKGGNQEAVRGALTGQTGWPYQQAAENSDRLARLFHASDYKAPGPIYRVSPQMGEFPGGEAKAGQVFYMNPTSWTGNSDFAYAYQKGWKAPSTGIGPPILTMEPGSKTLPISGIMGFPQEHEHIVSGLVRVKEANNKVVRLEQIAPHMIPRPPAK